MGLLKKVEKPPSSAADFFARTADVSRPPELADEVFSKLPYKRSMAIAGRTRNALLAVLVELAHQRFTKRQKTVTLGNVAFRAVGISPDAKVRALRQLEADGMIAVDWRGGRKTPLVTLLWTS